MCALLLVGTVGSFVKGPFYGIAVYYLFAVLRPQYLWKWTLPDIQWSFYVAVAAIVASVFLTPKVAISDGEEIDETPVRDEESKIEEDELPHDRLPRSGRLTPAGKALLLFGISVTFSYFFAIDRNVAFPFYVEYFKIFVMFFVSSLVLNKFSEIKVLYLIAVASLAYIAYEMNALYFLFGRFDIYYSGYGGLDNNGAGLMIAMGIPMAYFLWQGYTKWWRWLFMPIVPMMLNAVFLSNSRGAMLSLLATAPLLAIRGRNKKATVLALLCLSMMVLLLAGKQVRARFSTVGQYQQDYSAQSRFESWEAAVKIALQYPVFGAGIQNSNLLSHEYGADIQGRTIHSVYFKILADSGFPALGFYLAALFFTWRALRRFQNRHRDQTSQEDILAYNLACGIESALVTFCVGAAFLGIDTFELPFLLILMGTLLPSAVVEKETSPVASDNPEPGDTDDLLEISKW